MKLAHISTINTLKTISASGDIQFCLAPYCNNKDYKKYFMQTKDYVLLDNGVAENILIPNEELVNLAIEMKVNELIIPDVIGDYHKTKEQREDFLNKYYDKLLRNNIKIQTVVQGQNIKEYVKCLNEIENDDRIDIIGIPFRMNYCYNKNLTKEENQCFNRLNFLKIYITKKPIHCLGCNLPIEIRGIKELNLDNVRSIDSKIMARYGINNQIFDWNDKVKPEKKLFIDYNMNMKELDCALKNISKLRSELE